ncbi:MAG: transcriptional regulator [Flavobacterium sp. MedPE-SWcel]|uniref:helix-turn-helix domain-containing protein n=1 Tax=uncultured Flavobacterium sp. TaxID=165435 RepID=UPI00090EFC45|nr:helix-turn-helix transcriptional regulator [uncultured Flavobacterium sp.]OIQ16954.1 MAG: transcriptional regulator [Flavobacterium sp. MedPE-SWcel]
MVNIEDFIKRLETILDYYSLSASVFADKLGVQRSSLSHLLSGRNKPSLDFVLKITDNFPEVDLYWLLNGQGNFPKQEAVINDVPTPPTTLPKKESVVDHDLFSSDEKKEKETQKNEIEENRIISNLGDNTIERIVIFYKNGTFKNYTSQ